jgi:hypothetical protein
MSEIVCNAMSAMQCCLQCNAMLQIRRGDKYHGGAYTPGGDGLTDLTALTEV